MATCPVDSCGIDIAVNELACGPHWDELPGDLKGTIFVKYAAGDWAGFNVAMDAAEDFWTNSANELDSTTLCMPIIHLT